MRSWVLVGASLSLGSVLFAAACNRTGSDQKPDETDRVGPGRGGGRRAQDVGRRVERQGGTPKLLDATFTFNVPAWEPVIEYTNGTLQRAAARQRDVVWQQPEHLEYHVEQQRVPMSLTADLGGGQASLTLGSLNVSALRINMGAGELNLDLRGAPKAELRCSCQRRRGVGAHSSFQAPSASSPSAEAGFRLIDVRGLEKHGNGGSTRGTRTIRL